LSKLKKRVSRRNNNFFGVQERRGGDDLWRLLGSASKEGFAKAFMLNIKRSEKVCLNRHGPSEKKIV
jgi:hypothetical protein